MKYSTTNIPLRSIGVQTMNLFWYARTAEVVKSRSTCMPIPNGSTVLERKSRGRDKRLNEHCGDSKRRRSNKQRSSKQHCAPILEGGLRLTVTPGKARIHPETAEDNDHSDHPGVFYGEGLSEPVSDGIFHILPGWCTAHPSRLRAERAGRAVWSAKQFWRCVLATTTQWIERVEKNQRRWKNEDEVADSTAFRHWGGVGADKHVYFRSLQRRKRVSVLSISWRINDLL